jgi:hypothetical protein
MHLCALLFDRVPTTAVALFSTKWRAGFATARRSGADHHHRGAALGVGCALAFTLRTNTTAPVR